MLIFAQYMPIYILNGLVPLRLLLLLLEAPNICWHFPSHAPEVPLDIEINRDGPYNVQYKYCIFFPYSPFN